MDYDFLTDGIINKTKFFDGFEKEVILFVDEHCKLEQKYIDEIRSIVDCLVIRKHTSEPNFNDWNYQTALALGRGDIIVHFDQDTAVFSPSQDSVNELLGMLKNHKVVSYPSHWTPNAVHDDSFNYKWASTRFFMCRRDTLDLTELRRMQLDYEYYIDKYKPSRVCHWSEHLIGCLAGSDVYYPPIELNKYAIFTWGRYEKGLLKKLNETPYNEVVDFINSKGGIQYPNDIYA